MTLFSKLKSGARVTLCPRDGMPVDAVYDRAAQVMSFYRVGAAAPVKVQPMSEGEVYAWIEGASEVVIEAPVAPKTTAKADAPARAPKKRKS